jgi:hypothetical protein
MATVIVLSSRKGAAYHYPDDHRPLELINGIVTFNEVGHG